MATAVAAAKTARAAANGGRHSSAPLPAAGLTRLRWLPPGPTAPDGRAAILEERRPRPRATCAPIGGRRRLVIVSIAPARGHAEGGAGPRAGRRPRGPSGWALARTGGHGERAEAAAGGLPSGPGGRRARALGPRVQLLALRSVGRAEGQEWLRPSLPPGRAPRTLRVLRTRRHLPCRKTSC
ncbi:uncharacterized protein LOC142456965 [Tenrec ecaudatus]|uniref:uncharacterized protein LOC142456965 n=1 Tax=Tenrec ecaudatus TaxID=94439 RepID=UPI003F59B60E